MINLEKKIYQPRSMRPLHSRQIWKNKHSSVILSYPLSYRPFLFKLICDNFSDPTNDDAECEYIHLALKFTL